MTPYWKEWKEIVLKAKEGNDLALAALSNLIDALAIFDYSTHLDKWLEEQDFLHSSKMIILCEHTFVPIKENPGFLRCAFCANNVHKDVIARWKEQGWIREV